MKDLFKPTDFFIGDTDLPDLHEWICKQANKKLAEYIESLPSFSDKCIVWRGGKSPNGYGSVYFNGTPISTHRISFVLFNGKITKGMFVCHTCDNPSCINPRHLFLGTAKDNTQDMIKKGRHHEMRKTHCSRGHEYNKENTYMFKGKRSCRKCSALNAKLYRKNKTPEQAEQIRKYSRE